MLIRVQNDLHPKFSVNSVCSAAGLFLDRIMVGRAATLRHRLKMSIAYSVYRDSCSRLQIKEFRRIASLDLPPLDRFKLLIRTHLTFQDSHRNESKIFSLREEPFPDGKKDLNKKFQTETFFIYRSEIERLLASKGRKGNSTIAAFSALGAVVWFLRWYNPEGRNSLEEVIQAITDHILYGIIGEKQPDDKKQDN